MTEATYDLVRGHWPDAVEVTDLGKHRLKDFPRLERLLQVIPAGAPAAFPPLKTLPVTRDLVVPPAPLIGRARERQAIGALLRRADVRLVTLTGLGGSGKTRLALQTAADAAREFDDGVVFVELAPIADPRLVGSAIAQALGLAVRDESDALDAVAASLRAKRLLLVLDNFEQLVAAAPDVARLLGAAPELTILVTSRVALRLSGDHEYAVAPLDVPAGDPADMAAIARTGAVALFVDRATSVDSSFELTPRNARAVGAICARLDGLPLAIELAAARVKALSPDALLRRLGPRLAVLTAGRADAPARHRTLRATLDWSHDLLGDAERDVFATLGVFVGGWTIDAAEALVAPPADALEKLAALHDHSLIQRSAREDGEPRYGMLETVREYAVERLEERSDAAAVRARHAQYYLDVAERAEPDLPGPGAGPSLRSLDAERENIRAALACSAQHREPETALRLGAALWRYWQIRGELREPRQRLEEVLARTADEPHTPARATGQACAGRLAYFAGDHPAARAHFDAALAAHPQVGERAAIAFTLLNLGMVHLAEGDHALARQFLYEALSVAREIGARLVEALALSALGWVAFAERDSVRAVEPLDASLRLMTAAQDQRGIAIAMTGLGAVAVDIGDHDRARRVLHQSLAITRELGGDVLLLPGSLASLGLIAQAEGNLVAARDSFTAALDVHRAAGNGPGMLSALERLAGLAAREGRAEHAARLFGAAAALRETVGWGSTPFERSDAEAEMAALRARLPRDVFAARGRTAR